MIFHIFVSFPHDSTLGKQLFIFLIDMCEFNQTIYEVDEGGEIYLYLTLLRPLKDDVDIKLTYSNDTPSKSCIIITTNIICFEA